MLGTSAPPFLLSNWYWAVADHPGVVYSSRLNIYVPDTDATYVAWGLTPVPIPDEVELWSAVSTLFPEWMFDGTTFVQPSQGAYTKAQLAGYAADVRWQAEVTGVSGGTAYRSDRVSRALQTATLTHLEANPGTTVEWKALDGSFHTLDAAQMTVVNTDINTHVEGCYTAEKTAKYDIDSGAITTLEQIDAVFAPLRMIEWKESYRKGL